MTYMTKSNSRVQPVTESLIYGTPVRAPLLLVSDPQSTPNRHPAGADLHFPLVTHYILSLHF